MVAASSQRSHRIKVYFIALLLTCLRGAFPPVDLRAVCFVRAMVLLFPVALVFLCCVVFYAAEPCTEFAIAMGNNHRWFLVYFSTRFIVRAVRVDQYWNYQEF